MSDTSQIPRIKRLSSSLANQIAAGEVIERPASVVKELLENCLDAGASRITVNISKAGSQLIRVTDNGHGIHPDDLQLSLERHATAKLDHGSDLTAIRSLGFRGEALPSISSVATVKLISRIAKMEQVKSLMYDPMTGTQEIKPAAHPVGTTVEVSQLFHNTPARRKFLCLVDELLNHNVSTYSSMEIRDAMIKIMLNHLCDIPDPTVGEGELTGLLHQLAYCGLDVKQSHFAPIWTSISPSDLDSLISRD